MDFPLYFQIFYWWGRINFLEIDPYIFRVLGPIYSAWEPPKVKTTYHNYHPLLMKLLKLHFLKYSLTLRLQSVYFSRISNIWVWYIPSHHGPISVRWQYCHIAPWSILASCYNISFVAILQNSPWSKLSQWRQRQYGWMDWTYIEQLSVKHEDG